MVLRVDANAVPNTVSCTPMAELITSTGEMNINIRYGIYLYRSMPPTEAMLVEQQWRLHVASKTPIQPDFQNHVYGWINTERSHWKHVITSNM